MSGQSAPEDRLVNWTLQAPMVPSLSRYDWAMLNIPLGYFAALLASPLLPTSLLTTMSVASVLGMLVIADVLFWHPPMSEEPEQADG